MNLPPLLHHLSIISFPPPTPCQLQQLQDQLQIFLQFQTRMQIQHLQPPIKLELNYLPSPIKHTILPQTHIQFHEPPQEQNQEPLVRLVELEGRAEPHSIQDFKIFFVAEVVEPARREKRARRVREKDDEFGVERVLDRRYFHCLEQFLIKWHGNGDDENSWHFGYEKRREIPHLIEDYFNANGIVDDGITLLNSNDGEFVENRQQQERPLLAKAAKRPRFN
jgi:hypothetical protein